MLFCKRPVFLKIIDCSLICRNNNKNPPIYREILLKFLQFTEKYYVTRTPFHFRRHTEVVLRRTARLAKAFSTARPSTPKNGFIRRSEPCYMKKLWHASAQHGV